MGDLIWREDAIIELVFNEETKDIKCEDMRKVLNVLKKMPSAEPKQSIAEWQKDFREYINMLNISRDDYNGIMEYINVLPSAEPENTAPKTFKEQMNLECEFCRCHECGDTLYESSDWDGGISFDYIRDIKYCPICGRMLLDD